MLSHSKAWIPIHHTFISAMQGEGISVKKIKTTLCFVASLGFTGANHSTEIGHMHPRGTEQIQKSV